MVDDLLGGLVEQPLLYGGQLLQLGLVVTAVSRQCLLLLLLRWWHQQWHVVGECTAGLVIERVDVDDRGGLDIGSSVILCRGALHHEAVEQLGYVVHAGGVRRREGVTIGGSERRRAQADELGDLISRSWCAAGWAPVAVLGEGHHVIVMAISMAAGGGGGYYRRYDGRFGGRRWWREDGADGLLLLKLLLEVGVPVVLDVVVGSLREVRSNGGPPVAEQGLEVDDDAFLVGGEVAAADAGAEVVGPAEAAALAAAHEARVDGHGAPVAGAVLLDVGHQDDVLLRRPWPLLDPHLVAARRPAHRRRSGH